MEWHQIHDFFHGWGLQEHIPDNEIVLESHTDGPIPWKVVRSKVVERTVWYSDAMRLLDVNIFAEGVDVLDVYERLDPLLKKEHEERVANYKPVKFDKITIPKINRLYPESLL